VYAAGNPPPSTLWTFDGNKNDEWSAVPVESPKFIKDVYPTRINAQGRVSGIWGTDAENVFVVTKEKQVLHFAVHP